MNRFQARTLVRSLPYITDLFDEPSGNGGDAGSGDAPGDAGNASSANGAANGSARSDAGNRDQRGRFASGDVELTRELTTAQQRIRDLNESDKTRRLENKELKTTVTTLQSQIELTNRRAIRAEARVALTTAGAVDADVVDLFLKWAGEKVKVDDQTGDIVGMDLVGEYQKAKPAFFKAASNGATGGDQGNASGDASGDAGAAGANASANGAATQNGSAASGQDTRGNATGRAASLAGGSANGAGGAKIADFRNPELNADAAFERYKATLR